MVTYLPLVYRILKKPGMFRHGIFYVASTGRTLQEEDEGSEYSHGMESTIPCIHFLCIRFG